MAEEIGTTLGEIVRLLLAQLVKRRSVPFSLSADAHDADGLVDVRRRNKILGNLDNSKGW